ncbi:MAG: SIS domain-containing protein [Thermoproteota archaeon]|jgi:fructoselysine-6-P-deglycase FrlB-like protein|nr:SIS domain-containing protein [Thermoproteota archaeon]
MNAIEAMQAEIEYQVQDLHKLELSSPVSNCLFVGSGDSYIAGLAAQYYSGSQAICCSPIDIIKNHLLVKRRNLFVVSISGNTQANILAAKIAKKHGVGTISALTARSSSRLAKSCDQTIVLKYKNTGITTAGTISFTLSMIKCISLSTELQLPANLRKIYNHAEKQAKQAISKIDNRNNNSNTSYFILGNSQLHAIALYGALKFNEIFGVKAMAYPAEEFCHSPLFSIKETDQAIVLGGDDDDDNSRNLSKRLNEEGFSSVHVGFKRTGIELLLQSTFFIQLFALKLAQKYGLTSCYFLRNKKLLRVSSDFIYH